MDPVSADRLIEGSGTPESAWRAWLGAADVPCAPWQRWLSDAERLVVVAPHPDDEVLACGALLSAHAAQGGESLLIAITDGEASHADRAHGGVLQLAATRRAESAEGLKRLGLMQPRVMRLGLPDGGVSRHGDALLQSLIAALRPNDVVITTWRFDGHPDHEMTGLATARACVVQGCRLLEAPVWMWHWASPGDARVPWPRLRALHLSPVQVACKQAALAAHATQLAPRADGQGPVLGAAIRARAARDAEYFIV